MTTGRSRRPPTITTSSSRSSHSGPSCTSFGFTLSASTSRPVSGVAGGENSSSTRLVLVSHPIVITATRSATPATGMLRSPFGTASLHARLVRSGRPPSMRRRRNANAPAQPSRRSPARPPARRCGVLGGVAPDRPPRPAAKRSARCAWIAVKTASYRATSSKLVGVRGFGPATLVAVSVASVIRSARRRVVWNGAVWTCAASATTRHTSARATSTARPISMIAQVSSRPRSLKVRPATSTPATTAQLDTTQRVELWIASRVANRLVCRFAGASSAIRQWYYTCSTLRLMASRRMHAPTTRSASARTRTVTDVATKVVQMCYRSSSLMPRETCGSPGVTALIGREESR